MKVLQYGVIEPNKQFIEVSKQKEDSYTILKERINATIGHVSMGSIDFWISDTGILDGEDVAIIIKNDEDPRITDYDLVLFGTVVITSSDRFGNTTSINEEGLKFLQDLRLVQINGKSAFIYYNVKKD